eukprot:1640442-Amphidinium_carterae.1
MEELGLKRGKSSMLLGVLGAAVPKQWKSTFEVVLKLEARFADSVQQMGAVVMPSSRVMQWLHSAAVEASRYQAHAST